MPTIVGPSLPSNSVMLTRQLSSEARSLRLGLYQAMALSALRITFQKYSGVGMPWLTRK